MAIPLALVWHQHQPNYKDPVAGEMVLPWARLHGVKDYYGMARLVSQFPGMKCTINLVPSMLAQLQDYVQNNGTDPFLRRSVIPADALSGEDALFVLDHFFMAQWERMIKVYPRYAQLLELRRFGKRTAAQALPEFTVQDLRDLQVWFNLTWFHPVSFEESEALRSLRAKGRGFSEQDKELVLREQKAVLAKVIPLHKELAERKQLELTTTPFYHPILPLLCDMRSCQAAMPRTPLPNGNISLAEDADEQVRKAVEFHKRLFGVAPEGMWPSEGSVSPDIVPILARHGVKWIATDEEILAASLNQQLRGSMSKLDRPDVLYRPWRYETAGARINIVFRDHHLSDLIGFQYQGWDGAAAADDFLLRVQSSALSVPGEQSFVPVILDGENCWEHYPDQGLKFLRTLYAKLEKGDHNVVSTRVCDFINAHPPQHRLEKLFPGSWINHDFYIWVGHQEDRRAWEYVYRTREDLVAATKARGVDAKQDPALAQAWEELYVAEGSDWYWWYGDDHSSGDDATFDELFRKHLKNVYRFIGQPAPRFLDEPIKAGVRIAAAKFTQPTAGLQVRVDGRVTSYFEWLGAGRYQSDREGGVMNAATRPLVKQVLFGYDAKNLCLRVDMLDELVPSQALKGAASARRRLAEELTLGFPDLKLSVKLNANDLKRRTYEGAWKKTAELDVVEAAWEEVAEMRVPFQALGVKANQELTFYVEVSAPDRIAERYPRTSELHFTVPPEHVFEQEWMV